MGGALIVLCVVVPTLLWSDLRNVFVWLVLAITLAFAGIGFWDDYQKVRQRNNLGLTARTKVLLQILVSFIFAIALIFLSAHNLYSTNLTFPFFKRFRPDFLISSFLNNVWTYPLAFIPFVLFVVLILVGSSNAVNLTDGLDGLAIGCVIISGSALTVLTYVAGHATLADYLDLEHLPRVAELTVFCGAMVGASLGFLWYNAYPAEIFMGDVGSLSLGGAIATVAVIIKQELLLPFIGGIFVTEALSVIVQVASYKLRGKRVFRMAPIHHHFELIGWKESKIIARFWIAALVFALFALTTLKLR
jgi:phospho-N-acetylmuramoyl-pentapeptide-transferase